MAGKNEAKSAFDSETFEKDGHFKIDRPIGSASISPCGRDVVLASRDGLDIIDLDNPYTAPRHLSHQTPWEVADVQWSPFASRDYWIVSTSNQKALVWNVGLPDSRASVEHVLHGHKRAITDINFSAHYPDILATCAVDSFVHCWDLRRPSKPVLTFCDWFAGATQVKWNRQEAHILASSHDKHLKIWDDRNGAQPLKTIAAHATKIYGVDWDRKDTRMLTTCSLDQTIKSWDYTSEVDVPTKTIQTLFPVWRARYTPFGHGVVALPQRDDFDLHLYDQSTSEITDGSTASIHQFKGHTNQVKEFLWRVRGDITESDDTREFQLVSWGADQQLRLHRINRDVVLKVDPLESRVDERPLNFTRKGAKYKTYQKEQKQTQDSIFGWNASQLQSGLRSGISRGLRPYATGYGSEGFMSSINRNKIATKEMDPISWMRGVKIRKQPSPPTGAAEVMDNMFPPDPKTTSWDNFDSLGEEVTMVLDKFPKVGIEMIDIKHRILTLLLPGTSIKNKPATHLKCRLEFPKPYPIQASPKLSIENSESVESAFAATTANEVKKLSAAYLRLERHSLEAILRLLLGELTLDESIQLLEKPQDLAASTIMADSSSSSSDDEDALENGLSSTSKVLDSNNLVSVDNTQYNVPRPNTCGAKFTVGGALVYFLSPKREETSLLGQSLGIGSQTSSTSREIFEGFGRLHQSHRSKRMSPTQATTFSDDSESESFELSSSESSTFSTDPYQMKSAFMPTAPWNGLDTGLPFGRDVTASQHSLADVALTQQTSLSASKVNTRVSILRLIDGLPSGEVLARSYQYGPEYDAAQHNAMIAKKMGYGDLESIWHLCSLLLRPIAKVSEVGDDITVANGQILAHVRKEPSDVREDRAELKWASGQDAKGNGVSRWLANQSIQCVERSGDVQTLAMLTCALSPALTTPLDISSPKVTRQTGTSDTIAPFDQYSATQNKTQYSSYTDSWKEDLSSLFAPKETSAKLPTTSFRSERFLSGSSSPPDSRHLRANSISRLAQLSALSSSHDDDRGLRRTSSTLHTFAIPPTNAIQYSHSAASSPPNGQFKKKPSPAGSLLGTGQSSGAWMPSQWLSKASLGSEESRSTISPPKPRAWGKQERTGTGKQDTTLQIRLTNQNFFRSDDTSLLDSRNTVKHQKWSRDYAEILSAWGMPLESAEIQKHNHVSNVPQAKGFTNSRLSDALRTQRTDSLEFRCHCNKCGHIRPVDSKAVCERCRWRPRPPLCIYCRKYITGLSSSCLACGHTLHMTCRLDLVQHVIAECVTGCGCRCADHTVVEIPMPNSQPAKVDMSLPVPGPRPKFTRNASSAHDDGAYHSLAKALDKRRESRGGLKATSSTIWRGG